MLCSRGVVDKNNVCVIYYLRIRNIGAVVIVEDDRPVGIVSIGDLVKAVIAEEKYVIEQLGHYIHH